MNWWRLGEAIGTLTGPFRGVDRRITLGECCREPALPAIGGFDHSPFDALLARHVDDRGRVAYARWKADPDDRRALDEYLVALGRVDRHQPAPLPDRLAFWINAYNAATVAGVLHNYPGRCACRRGGPFGFRLWRDTRLWVGSEWLSLARIEHRILRRFGEPRIHFAIVCAARGCPSLRNRAYTAAELDAQLDANARQFLARPDAYRYDPVSNTLHLSRLFKWYARDFAPTDVGLMNVLGKYLPALPTTTPSRIGRLRFKYTAYDWTLNDQQSVPLCSI